MNLGFQARALALSSLLSMTQAPAQVPAQAPGPVTSGEATPTLDRTRGVQRIDLTTGADGRPQRWTASNPESWTLTTPGRLPILALEATEDHYAPPVRSPHRIALADGATFGDFRLTVEAQQTSREYGHRDLCVVFGFQAPDRFYYTHFATTPDQNACNVFLVDGAPRRPLAPIPARGVDWGATRGEGAEPPWRRLTVERQGDLVRAWFEGELILEARDTTLGAGLVGLGSFDDSGRFRNLVVTGTPGPPSTSPFPAIAARATLEPAAAWPAGAGPRGDWSSTGPSAPLTFNANTGENVLWRAPMPATGQGGIAVHSGRVFVATMRPWDPREALSAEDAARFQHATEGRSIVGKHILARCHDADTGALLWERELSGEVPAIHSYPFSDATSASPVTDGTHVWFTNAAGRVVCFTLEGEVVWERTYTPAFDGPFNKQFEPFLVQDGARAVFVHMEPFPAPGADPEALVGRWHHLVGLDAATGELLWRSADALTQYNAPTLVATDDGMCALIGRGGPHDVPERPVGASLVRLNGARAGTSVWRYEDPRGNHEAALHVMTHDERYAYWVLRDPASAIVALDLATGAEVATVSLGSGVTQTTFDGAAGVWRTAQDVTLDRGVFPARYSAHAANGWVYFQCYDTAFGRATLAPSFSFGRADVVHGRVEYLEVPTDVTRDERGAARFVWRAPRAARALDRNGVEVTGDERSRWSGWDWVFNGAPTRVNDRLSYTLANGLVYTFDARAAAFNGDALLAVNELGPAGGVWTANSLTYANGRLYHRTSAELLCFALTPGRE
ncbi:MAG: PQQ-binding-like beta-propeller repeat protein [Planctomycetota bacterium]